MIASIVLKGKYNIGINTNNKIKVEDHLLAISEIPFIRYRFDKYTDEEIEFIRANKKKFNGPIHMVEVNLDSDIEQTFERLETIDKLVKFIYVPVDDDDIANGLKQETLDNLSKAANCFFDRIMIKDNTSMMYELAADRIKIKIEKTMHGVVKSRDIGVCSSPLSFRNSDVEGQACLTAVWARKLMAEFSDNSDMAIPTASHECMTCCGCARYFVVDHDLPAPLSAKEKDEKKNTQREKTDKPNKPNKPAGIPRFLF